MVNLFLFPWVNPFNAVRTNLSRELTSFSDIFNVLIIKLQTRGIVEVANKFED